MAENTKGSSPFYPGQPIPVNLFTGRIQPLKRIMTRGVAQVAAGKPVTMFVRGEYGIGKSSLANYARAIAETRNETNLHGVYVTLGAASSLQDVGGAILEGFLHSGAFVPERSQTIRKWLARYISKLTLFGIDINKEAVKNDALRISGPEGLLAFLRESIEKLKPTGVTGLFLILDEINGITSNPQFAHFVKGIVDTNAISRTPVPLLLMLCGVEERRSEMIRLHPPVGRVFDVIDVEPMGDLEARDFFTRAFGSVNITVDADAMDEMTFYSGGLPKIMHEIGDAAYYIDQDSRIDRADARGAVEEAADEVGRKYVETEVYNALKSKTYHSILSKLGKLSKTEFSRDELAADLTFDEAKTLDNFLQRLKKLNVIRPGEVAGEYAFNIRMYQVYITLKTIHAQAPASSRQSRTRG